MEPDLEFIRPVAALVTGWYRRFVQLHEVENEMVLWWLTHQDDAARYLDEDVYDRKEGERILTRCLRRAGSSYARAQRAVQLGYEPEDEVFYNREMVREFLPCLFGQDGTRESRPEVSSTTPHRPDSSQSMNFETTIADVASAFSKLSKPQQRLLMLYGSGHSMAEIGATVSVSADAAKARVERALDSLVRRLGGTNPHPRGGRRAMSNAQAQAITSGQEAGE